MSNTSLLKCHNCDHEWDYTGKSLYYATCPKCRFKVKIPAEYDCPYCDETRPSPRELRRHVRKEHRDKIDDFSITYHEGQIIPPRRHS